MTDISPGQTFLAKTGSPSDSSKKHMYVVLTEPVDTATRRACVLWVCWSSVREGRFHDDTCILDVGDHPFITRRTWVNYEQSAIVTVEEIRKNLNRGVLTKEDPLKESALNRIVEGLGVSEFTPMEVVEFHHFYQTLT
jgi:hypothetical protein